MDLLATADFCKLNSEVNNLIDKFLIFCLLNLEIRRRKKVFLEESV